MMLLLLGCETPEPVSVPDPRGELVDVPEGAFTMGHPDEEHGAYGQEWKETELPPHDVTVAAFAVQRDEVSVTQWVLFLDTLVGNTEGLDRHVHPLQPVSWDGSAFTADDGDEERPARFVSWYDAATWCAWAGMRLPTEAEWERVAKGADDRARRYPWAADDIDCSRAVYFTGTTRCADEPAAVGSHSPGGDTPEGVRDLAGNVAEWVGDRYGPYEDEDQDNPTGAAEGPHRVVRGGGYREGGDYARTTARFGAPPELRSEGVGFRCVVSR